MEIWILLAAAGSGYLAQYWQSSHKSKEVSIDITDNDDDHSGSSIRTLPLRRRYRSLPSTRRGMKGSFYKNRLVSKFSQGVGKMTGGCVSSLYVPVGDAEESHEAQAWHNCVIPDSCSCSSTHTQLDSKRDAAACLHSTYAISSSNIPSRCPAPNTFNAYWPRKCCGFDGSKGSRECGRLLPEKIASVSPEAVLDSRGCCMSTLYSAHCTDDSAMGENGFMLQDGSPTNCINDALYNNVANGERAFSCDRAWIPGYWDSFQDFSALRTNDSLKMQEHEGRSSSSTRKVRSHQSNEGSRSYTKRRRSLASCRSTTSPDSGLSVLSADDYSQEVADGHIHNSLACEQPFIGLGEHLCNEEVKADPSGNYLGEENGESLSSPSKMSLRMLNEVRNSESLVKRKEMDGDLKRSFHSCCLPFQVKISGQEKACRECSGGDNSELQESGNDLLKVLLFNFGVGVGMMFAIMSNKPCTKHLIRLLEEALCLLKNLEGEVQGRKKLRFEFYNARDTRENVLAEQSHAVSKILRRIIELVEQTRVSLSKDSASVSALDYRQSEERARLEAELEAELERMEMNLGFRDVTELCQRSSGVSEDDLEIGVLVQGELSTRGIRFDVEAHSEKEDGRDSSYEVIHFGNGGVPPIELAKRLHEVLEARQDRKISELEAEIKHLDSRLQAKEKEFQVWKQRVWHLLQDSAFESLSGFHQKGVCVKTEDTTKKVPFSLTQEEKQSFSTGMHHSAIVSPVSAAHNERFLNNDTKEASSLHQRGPHPRPCLGDEAYEEVCEEFFELWSDTATESPSHSHYGRLKGAHPELEQVSDTNDATNDTLASTRQTVAHHHLEDQLNCKVGMEASSRKNHSNLECKHGLNLDCNGEVLLHPDTTSLSQEKPAICAQDVIDIFESHGQFGRVLDWSMFEDSSYSSELDEQLCQLLIKRIVEKSKRDSSIVEVAESVMASLDIDETDPEIESTGGSCNFHPFFAKAHCCFFHATPEANRESHVNKG